MNARAYLAATLLIAVSLPLAACGASTPAGSTVQNPKAAKPAGSWPYPNGDLANTRDAAASVISSANVSGLTHGRLYLASSIGTGPGGGILLALDVRTGKLAWKVNTILRSSNSSATSKYGSGEIRHTGAIVYEHTLPTLANAPIAIAGNAILVPAGGPSLYGPAGGSPQLVTYTVPSTIDR